MKAFSIVSRVLMSIALLLVLITSCPAATSTEERDQSRIDTISTMVLKAAWPSAIYDSCEYEKTTLTENGNKEVYFKIHAQSRWTHGPLWLEVKTIFDRDLHLIDFQWGEYKAIVPPGLSASICKNLIKSFNESHNNQKQTECSSQ